MKRLILGISLLIVLMCGCERPVIVITLGDVIGLSTLGIFIVIGIIFGIVELWKR